MYEELVKKVYEVGEHCETDHIVVLTNHLKISGKLCNKCKEDKPSLMLTLTDASIWLLNDLCKCGDDECKCSTAKICHLAWLNLNIKKIVGFSFIK